MTIGTNCVIRHCMHIYPVENAGGHKFSWVDHYTKKPIFMLWAFIADIFDEIVCVRYKSCFQRYRRLRAMSSVFNDMMYSGPGLQGDLATILLRSQKHKYVYTNGCTWIIRTFKDSFGELFTVTYGTASAPYLAIEIFPDEQQNWPKASQITFRDWDDG